MASASARVTGILISLIGTVRNVGYRFVTQAVDRSDVGAADGAGGGAEPGADADAREDSPAGAESA